MKIAQRIHQSSDLHWVGNGFPVRSVFDYNGLGRELSPFLLLDYAAPHVFPPGGRERRGVGAHPHRGFETVTVVYDGELEHRDSSGGGGRIGPGDVQWMTAGAGIVHEEFHSEAFTRAGGNLEMVQLWVNLAARDKKTAPGYQTILASSIPIVSLPGNAGTVRVVSGDCYGQKGPARTFTPINVWDVRLRAGSPVELPLPDGHTSGLLVLRGRVRMADDQEAGPGEFVTFSRAGAGLELKASTDATGLVLTGEPIVEPMIGQGPFVMNTREEIRQAFEDYEGGRMGALMG